MLKFWLRNIKTATLQICQTYTLQICQTYGLSVLLGVADVFPPPPYDGEHPANELELDGVEHRARMFSLCGLPLVILRHLIVVCYCRECSLCYHGLDVGHGQL